ncbi:diacylglycerol/lipid kinase family protein [Goodfellowiella coeruleoviolacea]|uniref:Diacylglycerol kinase family enzyme n=1 Tax=Goodfellowiella coeruleoviolacea TaxID=334858 RepID=A0AAE3GDS9_9PSEU|nr:diacylglycerol kinase family protein [Goodfellowiella coeruleoviolacea]MCP2164278.1 Diacylglycerol kinase family enzyme [Goodfellowiella coeruleoviolacea]
MRGFTALVNPISGTRRAALIWARLADLLRARGAVVRQVPTRSAAHATELAEQAAHRGDVVVAVGGDGLVRDAAAGVVAADGTLAIVPAGRGNDLARALRLPGDPAALAGLLLSGVGRRVDVLEVAGQVVVGNAYAGIDSVANHVINRRRWVPGPLLYRLAPARTLLTWRPVDYTVEVDGVRTGVRGHTVVVANSGVYGNGVRIVPTAVLDDGLLDVLTLGDSSRPALARALLRARTGGHLDGPRTRLRTGRVVTLSANRPLALYADGDHVADLPATIRVRPGALEVIAPGPPHRLMA